MRNFGINNRIETPTLITPFSIIHLLTGMTLFFILRLYTDNIVFIVIAIIIIHTIYEFKDYYTTYIEKIKFKRDNYLASFFKDNTIENSIGDTIACIIGIIIAYLLNEKTILSINYLTKTSIVLNVVLFSTLMILNKD